MRLKEDYTRHIAAAFVLTLAIIASFQFYVFREPARIAADKARDQANAVHEGQALYVAYCTVCHGKQGEGKIGPALDDKTFLAQTADNTLFSLISSGVPDTQMPAWNQSHGGPFTDEQVGQIVTFVRAWEPAAPDRRGAPPVGDPARGATLFANICYACHGLNGEGTDHAPALNVPARLKQFDDVWYQATITQGRPAQGMPTWGTVLSPQQVADLVALLGAWREGQLAVPATTSVVGKIPRPSNRGAAGPAINLAGSVDAGAQVFATECEQCHGPEGKKGVRNPGAVDGKVPTLNPINPDLVDADARVFAYNLDLFLEHGSTPAGTNPKESEPAWGDEKKLTDQQIADVMAYVMSLNKP